MQRHYALLFEEGPELASDIGNLVFTGDNRRSRDARDACARSASTQPGARGRDRSRLAFRPSRRRSRSQRAREVLTEFVPALLSALGGTPDPDAALAALDRAFGRMPAVVELLTILQSHDRLRLLFADLLGTAPRLADTVGAIPARARRADRPGLRRSGER